ncbi:MULTISPECIES: serpin family protein [unclassified Nocardioides]|uniref:serpin family protein n=1 Tax=unclassified Nocardioides TaxID=2615069 RepID=UPI0009F14877|nr:MULTISPECIES: serpin family protein [unclassified Nocardioides]GAW47797.1 Serine protease inhibitor protein [Nocardioides sp. PD653-B2]GAW56157.1 Serine protease inhibitor protein [Nocardioides sp. PD653]
MLSRRAFSLATLAVAGAGLLAGCAGSPGEEGTPDGTTKLRLVSSDAERDPGDAAAVPAAVASVHALGAGLWRLLATGDDNVALSPYSVAVALGMTVNGAAGTTRSEMLDVLVAGTAADLNAGLNALTQHIESLAGRQVALDAANQLFGQQDVPWEPAFLDTLARSYGAGMRTVDFVHATEAARKAVNRWTADRTHDRIEEILPPDSVSAMTRLVLVNTLYFKAPWLEPFERTLTTDGDFHRADGTVVQVPMMRATIGAAVGTGDGWTSVRLPYADNALAMTVVLPDPGREVDVDALPAILAAAEPGSVELSVPRWTFRTAKALKDPLSALGMPTAFDEAAADFTQMTESDDPLVIDDVLHQVFVAVDEDGTEAAAATAVVVRASSALVVDRTVTVDRPFLFVIHDVEHGTPLFVGRVADPRS